MPEPAAARSSPPIRLLILIALWGAFVVWMIVDEANVPIFNSHPSPLYRGPPTYLVIQFALDLWALAAAIVVGFVGYNPFRWLNGKRLIIGSMAFAMMLGRLLAGPTITIFEKLPFELSEPFITVAAPFVLLFSGVLVILTVAALIAALFAFLVGIPVLLFNQILAFDNAIHVYRFQARGLAGYIVRAVYWLRNEAMPKGPPDETKGARFATQDEAAAIHNKTRNNLARMGFGHWPGKTDTPFFVATDKHVLVMASTRSGKGVALIIPHLLRYQGSAFVLDPKGENARATGRQRARLNGKVHYLDPFGITDKPRSRYNPLSRFTPENMEAESKALAAAIFVVEPRERSHWTDSGQQLLAALILYVYLSPEIPEDKRDLTTVRTILLGTLNVALEEMLLMEQADGLLRDLASSFLRTPEKEFGSIVSTAQRQTEIFDNPFMKACLAASGSTPEVSFDDWHRGTMTVYLCLAAPKFPTFNRWLRLVLTSALDTMTERLNPPPVPVCFMLDELATLGRLETVENAVGLSAGYGIQLVTVFQDVAQMRGLYEKRWSSFVGNAGVRALFNLDDHDTADYWSKFMGGRLVETYGRQEDQYGLSRGQNVGETIRPLIASDQLMMDFAAGRMLVLVQGARPIVTDRVPYYVDRTLVSLWDDPRGPVRTAAASSAGSVPPAGPAASPGPSAPPNGSGPNPGAPPFNSGPSPTPPPFDGRSSPADGDAPKPDRASEGPAKPESGRSPWADADPNDDGGSRPNADDAARRDYVSSRLRQSDASRSSPAPGRPINPAGTKPGSVNFTMPGFKPYSGNGTKPPKGPKGRNAR